MTKNIRMGHVINLMSIAYADGGITEEEQKFIYNVADDLGLTQEEFNHCLATWQETDEAALGISTPETQEEKIAFLKNMTLLMMMDGDIDDDERQYIINAAEHYGFDGEQAVDYLINMINEEYGGDDEEEEDDLFAYVDDESNISSGRYDLESKNIEEAFDTLYLSALRNEEARNIFLAIPDIDTRLYRLKPEQIELMQTTADRGYPLAKYVLGRYHQVVKPDEDSANKALELLKAAANEGIADACCALATMAWQGCFGPVNKETYDNLTNQALENGSPMAIRTHLLDLVHGGHGVKPNPKKAIDTIVNKIYTDENAEQTYPYYYAVLGDAYMVMGNEAKADECYEKAIDLGYFEAYADRFANKVTGPNAEWNREMFDMFLDYGCDAKDPKSFLLRALEGIHFYGKKDAAQQQASTAKIKEDLEEAVRLGEGRAAFYLGYCSYHGQYGFEEDNNAAWQWYVKGMQMDDGMSYGGLARMVDEGYCPNGLPEEFADTCRLNGLRRGYFSLLEPVVEAYRAGKLQNNAAEIEQIYVPMLAQQNESQPVSTVVVVNTEGQALICRLEKEDWGKANQLIGARRLAPVWVKGLDDIAKKVGLTERLTAWVDLEAPRKGLTVNAIAQRFYPGLIAGDIIFTLSDNLYAPMPFYGIEEAKAVIQALGAQLANAEVQELEMVAEQRNPMEIHRNMLNDNGFVARVEPDGKAYVLPSNPNMFKLFEEDIYDPARLDNLHELGQKLGLPGRLTMWTNNSALHKQIVMLNTIKSNPFGMHYYPGNVADNVFMAMEDENFNIMMFSDTAQLKATLMAMGLMPTDIVVEKE